MYPKLLDSRCFNAKLSHRRKRGFTLIEILVVVSILALLAAILFPVFSRVRENARRASCQSNLKQIGLAMAQYSDDYDDRLPQPWNYMRFNAGVWQKTSTSLVTSLSWRVFISPYIKDSNVFKCPSNKANSTITEDRTYPISYGCNYGNGNYVNNTGTQYSPMYMTVDPSLGITLAPMRRLQINNPESVWVVTESAAIEPFAPYSQDDTQLDQFASYLFSGHNARGNWLFVDGHVKALKPSQTAIPLNMWIPNATTQAPSNNRYYIRDKLLYADKYWMENS